MMQQNTDDVIFMSQTARRPVARRMNTTGKRTVICLDDEDDFVLEEAAPVDALDVFTAPVAVTASPVASETSVTSQLEKKKVEEEKKNQTSAASAQTAPQIAAEAAQTTPDVPSAAKESVKPKKVQSQKKKKVTRDPLPAPTVAEDAAAESESEPEEEEYDAGEESTPAKKKKTKTVKRGRRTEPKVDTSDMDSIAGLKAALMSVIEVSNSEKKRLRELEREKRELEDTLGRVLGISAERHHGANASSEVRVWDSKYAPPRTLAEVKFRDADGSARFPGMDIVQESKKKRGKIDDAAGSAAADEKAVEVRVGIAAHPEQVLCVPYYLLAEQAQATAAQLDHLNKNVLPIVDRTVTLVNALARKLMPNNGEDNVVPTLANANYDGIYNPMFPKWTNAPRLPHLVDGELNPGAHGRVGKVIFKNTSVTRDAIMEEAEFNRLQIEATAKSVADRAANAAEIAQRIAGQISLPSSSSTDTAAIAQTMELRMAGLESALASVAKEKHIDSFGPLFNFADMPILSNEEPVPSFPVEQSMLHWEM